jgi:cyclic beta-1,2-glucan synthetase
MLEGRTLTGSQGTVLDAVFALRYTVCVPAGGTARIAFWTCVAQGRSQVLELADKHRDINAHTRAATLAWTQAQVQLRHFGIDASQASLFQQLAGRILFADASRRASRRTPFARAPRVRSRCGHREYPAICPSCSSASRGRRPARGAPAAAGA